MSSACLSRGLVGLWSRSIDCVYLISLWFLRRNNRNTTVWDSPPCVLFRLVSKAKNRRRSRLGRRTSCLIALHRTSVEHKCITVAARTRAASVSAISSSTMPSPAGNSEPAANSRRARASVFLAASKKGPLRAWSVDLARLVLAGKVSLAVRQHSGPWESTCAWLVSIRHKCRLGPDP